MFRMMKLRQNVKGKVLSFAVSIATLALTIVGAFAVNFNFASADTGETPMSWDDVRGLFDEWYPGNSTIDQWFYEYITDDGENFTDDLVVFCNGGTAGLCICVYADASAGYDWYGSSYWQCFMQYYPPSNYFWGVTGGHYLYVDPQRVDQGTFPAFSSNFNWQFQFGVNGTHYFLPNYNNFFNSPYLFYANRELTSEGSQHVDQTIFPYVGPRSEYNNIVINHNGRIYFTFSDQSILQAILNNSNSPTIYIQAHDDEYNDWDYNEYVYNLQYIGLTSYNGVTNVGVGGILAWDITSAVQSWNWSTINYSCVMPLEDNPNHFADNSALISYVPQKDYYTEYYNQLQELLNSLNSSPSVIPDSIPSYVSQKVSTNYPGNIFVHDLGQVSFQGELPNPGMDQILVVDERIFDAFSFNIGIIDIGDQSFARSYCIELMQQSDLIVILDHSDFDDVVANYQYNPDNYRFFWNIQTTIGNVTFDHGLWYMTSARLSTGGSGEILYSGCPIITERYITKCNYYVLSDGIDLLYKGLNAIHDDNNNFFTGALNGILSVSSSVFANAETIGGKLDFLYKYLKFEVNLSDKFNHIIDKLEHISNNTSEQTHDYWFVSLYNWLLQFAPSNSDFATWVSDLTSFENQLPDPEATPAATVIPFPTVTAAAG